MAGITIREVASEANVSVTTAADILRGSMKYTYRAETVERVREVAERLGYRASAIARMLRRSQTRLVGVGINVNSMHLSPLVCAVHRALQARDYEPVLMELRARDGWRDGVIFPSPDMLAGILSIDLQLETNVSDLFSSLGQTLPIVALYPVQSKEVNCVTADRAHGVELTVEHLVGLGHRRMAFVSAWPPGFSSVQSKLQGWKRALRRFELDSQSCPAINLHPHRGSTGIGSLIVAALRERKPRLTALVCGDDMTACETIRHLVDEGWSVPQDISIAGYGEHQYAAISVPRLTTIATPNERIAAAAVERLIELIEQPDDEVVRQPRHQLFAPDLVARESTAAPIVSQTGRGK